MVRREAIVRYDCVALDGDGEVILFMAALEGDGEIRRLDVGESSDAKGSTRFEFAPAAIFPNPRCRGRSRWLAGPQLKVQRAGRIT